MTRADHFKNAYASLKETIIYEIRDIVRHQDDRAMELMETKRTPALVTTKSPKQSMIYTLMTKIVCLPPQEYMRTM